MPSLTGPTCAKVMVGAKAGKTIHGGACPVRESERGVGEDPADGGGGHDETRSNRAF